MNLVQPRKQGPLEESVLTKKYKELEEIEYEALKFSGLNIPQQIVSLDIPIGEDSWVHEIRCGFHNKQDIVLLHGYGGTSLTFVRLFKNLSERFRTHALDLLGMGLSHRKQYDHQSTSQQSVWYYVQAIEKWRHAVGIGKFVLAGHSFGGYLAACYSKLYPKHVERLVLLSPPGVMYMDQTLRFQAQEQMWNNASFGRKIFFSIAKRFLNRGTTPSDLLNCWMLRNLFINKVLSGRLGLEGEQKQVWKEYYYAIANLKPNSQRAFFKIFHVPKFGCQQNIGRILSENKFHFPIEFYYGDNDWMEKKTAWELVQQKVGGNNLKYNTINGSGHQLIFDNPNQVAFHILKRND